MSNNRGESNGWESLIKGVMLLGAGAAATYTAYKCYEQEEKKRILEVSNPQPQSATNALEIWSQQPRKKIIYVQNDYHWDQDCSKFIRDARKVGFVGFDTEFVNDGNTLAKAELLQLGNHLGNCLLVRLSNGDLPSELKDFLGDRNMFKCGLGVDADARRIENQFGIPVRSWVDLDHFDENPGHSLREMAFSYLNEDNIPKKKSYNWRNWEYSPEQKISAACDANLSCKLFMHFVKELYHPSKSRFESIEEGIQNAVKHVAGERIEKKIDRSRLLDRVVYN